MHLRAKIHLLKGFIQLVIESAGLGSRQIVAGYPKLALLDLSLRADHDAGHFARNPSPTQFCSIAPGDYFNRLLGNH
jgi:hypothetical protein